MADRQECLDRFYFQHGPCCAGCDWWRSISRAAGLCTKAAPVSGEQRIGMLGMDYCSLPLEAGHPLTPYNHFCGDFKDEFEWQSLPLGYQKRIGVPQEYHTND